MNDVWSMLLPRRTNPARLFTLQPVSDLITCRLGSAKRSSSPLLSRPTPSSAAADVTLETYKARREVFQQLMEFFFPQEVKEPVDSEEVIGW